MVYSHLKNYDESLKYYEKALHINDNYYNPNHIKSAGTLHQIGNIYYYKNK